MRRTGSLLNNDCQLSETSRARVLSHWTRWFLLTGVVNELSSSCTRCISRATVNPTVNLICWFWMLCLTEWMADWNWSWLFQRGLGTVFTHQHSIRRKQRGSHASIYYARSPRCSQPEWQTFCTINTQPWLSASSLAVLISRGPIWAFGSCSDVVLAPPQPFAVLSLNQQPLAQSPIETATSCTCFIVFPELRTGMQCCDFNLVSFYRMLYIPMSIKMHSFNSQDWWYSSQILGCPFKSGIIPGGWDISSAFEMLTVKSASSHPPSRGHHDGLRLCHRLPRGMGPFPEAGVLPPVPAGHPLRLHRAVGGLSGRHAAPPLPRPPASQPDTRVGEQQHPAGGEKRRRRRRSRAQPLLQIQTCWCAAFFRDGLAACWCQLVYSCNRGLFGRVAVWSEHLRIDSGDWGLWMCAHWCFPNGPVRQRQLSDIYRFPLTKPV